MQSLRAASTQCLTVQMRYSESTGWRGGAVPTCIAMQDRVEDCSQVLPILSPIGRSINFYRVLAIIKFCSWVDASNAGKRHDDCPHKEILHIILCGRARKGWCRNGGFRRITIRGDEETRRRAAGQTTHEALQASHLPDLSQGLRQMRPCQVEKREREGSSVNNNSPSRSTSPVFCSQLPRRSVRERRRADVVESNTDVTTLGLSKRRSSQPIINHGVLVQPYQPHHHDNALPALPSKPG